MFSEGISAAGDLIDLAQADGVVSKSGAWFGYGELRLGQGRENAKTYLKENPELAAEIRQAVLARRGLVRTPQETQTKHPEAPSATAGRA
jgi:recombination protein RecA